MLASAAAIVAGTATLRSAFPWPGWPFSPLVPFTDAHLIGGARWWWYTAGCEAAWSVALVVAVLALLRLEARAQARTAAAIIALQIALLAIAFSTRVPFNGGQYLYVAYAQLVQQGFNPYDPPARSDRVSPSLRAIGTMWGVQREGNRDGRRVVMRDRYGPAWTLGIAAALQPFRGASIETQAHVLRAAAAIAMLGCSIVLWFALGTIPWRCAALAAFALNPLVIVQTASGGHNDIFALFFALATMLCAMRGRFLAAGLLAGLCIATKLSFVPLVLPLLALAWTARGPRACAALAGAFAATIFAASLPFGAGRAYVQAFNDARAYNFSYLIDLAYSVTRHIPALHVPPRTFETMYTMVVVATAVALAIAVLRRRRVPALEAAIVMLIFCAGKFQPWYAIVLTPLLLTRAPWSIPLFLGTSLSAQIFGRKDFTGSIDDVPFLAFVALTVATTLAIALGQRIALNEPRPLEAGRNVPAQAEARNAATI